MGKYIIDNPVVTIDGDDYSNLFSEVTVEGSFEEVDVTGFGSTFREILLGMGDATISLVAFQDLAANKLNQNIWPIFIAKTPVVITVRSGSAVVSATNPKWTMTGVLTTYNPIAGAKGEASTTPLVWRNQAQTGIVQSFT